MTVYYFEFFIFSIGIIQNVDLLEKIEKTTLNHTLTIPTNLWAWFWQKEVWVLTVLKTENYEKYRFQPTHTTNHTFLKPDSVIFIILECVIDYKNPVFQRY